MENPVNFFRCITEIISLSTAKIVIRFFFKEHLNSEQTTSALNAVQQCIN